MLERISTTILLAIIAYHGLQYYKQWRLERTVEKYRLSVKGKKTSINHNGTFKEPRVIKASDNIYVAVGFALANSIMFVGNTGVVIIDTTESYEAAKRINEEFRKVTDKPVSGVIYTHNHGDHVLGTRAFIDNKGNSGDIEIWAHHTLMDIYFHSIGTVQEAHYYRTMHQFGVFLNSKQVSGRGFASRLQNIDSRGIIAPNRFLYKREQNITLAGIDLRLIHIPGESDDQIAVFWPAENVLICADDFYMAFPNLYAIRGTLFRSPKQWYESLDTMRYLHPEVLIPGHTEPMFGAEQIFSALTDYRDTVQLVHDQTVRFMNQGMHPDEIANQIHLPMELADKPYLEELYGTVRWSSKGLFSGYMGWFSGDIVELNPHAPDEHAIRLVQLAGGMDSMLTKAKESLENDDPQWALRLSSAALRYDSTNQMAKEIKVKSLFHMAALQTSMNGYNYYVTCAYTTLGTIQVKRSAELKRNWIRHAKMNEIFLKMSIKLRSEECSSINKVVSFIFPDTKESITFHVRNGVMDLSGKYERNADIKVTINSVAWREIISGEKSGLLSAVTSELLVEPGLSSLREVMDCIENI